MGLDPGQAPPSQPDEAEVGVSLDVEPTALVDDGGESADVESTGAGVSDVGDLAAVDLGMALAELDAEDSPAEAGVEASPVRPQSWMPRILQPRSVLRLLQSTSASRLLRRRSGGRWTRRRGRPGAATGVSPG